MAHENMDVEDEKVELDPTSMQPQTTNTHMCHHESRFFRRFQDTSSWYCKQQNEVLQTQKCCVLTDACFEAFWMSQKHVAKVLTRLSIRNI